MVYIVSVPLIRASCRFHKTLPNLGLILNSVSKDVRAHLTHPKLGRVTRPNREIGCWLSSCQPHIQKPMCT